MIRKNLLVCVTVIGMVFMITACGAKKTNTFDELPPASEIVVEDSGYSEEDPANIEQLPENEVIEEVATKEITEESTEEATTEEITEVETEEVTEEVVEIDKPDGVEEKPVEVEKPAKTDTSSKKSSKASSNTAQKPQSTPQTTTKPEASTSSEPKMETAEPVSGLTPEEQALVDALWEECGGGIVVNPQPPVGDGSGGNVDDSNAIFH